MIKKILYILGFLMFSTAFISPLITHPVLGADLNGSEATNDQSCDTGDNSYSGASKCVPFSAARIFGKMKLPVINEKDWSDVFGSDDITKAGQNIYAKIYDKILLEPEKQAAKNVTGAYGLTEAEMTQVLYGNFSAILKRKPSMTQEEAINKMAEMQQKFQEEKDLLTLQNNIEATVQPSELFYNDNVSDSGFDIVNDLGLIEKILFQKTDPIDVGGEFTGAEESPAPGTPENGGGTGGGGGAGADQQNPQSGNKNNGKTKPKPGDNNTGAPGSSGVVTPSPADNPNLCFGNDSLAQAIKDYDKTAKHDQPAPAPGNGGNDGTGKDGSSAPAKSANAAAVSGNSPADLVAKSDTAAQPVQPAPADDWALNPPCNEIFCLSVNFVKKPVERFSDSDNCIACHIEKIDAKLKSTITHSLIPGKATGNLIEADICKKAAFNSLSNPTFGMNFYAVSKPVQTPVNDDLIYGVGIDEEWKSFLSRYKPFPFFEKDAAKPDTKPEDLVPPSEIDRATKSEIAVASPDTTFEEFNKAVNREIKTNAELRAEQITVAEPATQSDDDAGFYQAIRREVEQMNYYFDNFKNILHSLHEEVDGFSGDHACTELKNKKQCE